MCGASGLLLAIGGLLFLFPPTPGAAEAAPWLWAAGAMAGLWFVLPSAARSAKTLRPDMNLLMTTAVIGASALGDWFEAASTAFLFSFALLMEAWSVSRARREVQALLAVTPKVARVVSQDLADFGAETEVPAEKVPPGSVVVVRPGDAVPLDGVVLAGETQVNEAPLTGESMPVHKEPGSAVLAGAINGDGLIRIRTTKPFQDTTIARIMHMVREAQARKAPISRWVDRFAAVYTPIMMLFSLLTAILPPLLGFGELGEWVRRGLVALVTACPCALAISTPVSVVAGLAAAVRRGALVKGGAFLEAAASVKAVAFDKTGTLTSGHLRVRATLPAAGRSEAELLSLAKALEAGATHPVGRAIMAYADTRDVAAPAVEEATNLPGLGAKGRLGATTYYAGSPKLFERITGKPFSPAMLADVPPAAPSAGVSADVSAGASINASTDASTGVSTNISTNISTGASPNASPGASLGASLDASTDASTGVSTGTSTDASPDGSTGASATPLAADLAPQALIFTDEELIGGFLLEDDVRPESAKVVRRLKALGVEETVMLTGDASGPARRIGAQAGVDVVHASLMPDEKLDRVRELRERVGVTIMVGDGVNDAPALAAADIGVAMGVAGAGAAIETADIALMSDDLSRLPWLIAHARRTLSVIRLNIVFALGIKAVFIVLALTGQAELWMAVAADLGSSLLVTAHGLSLLRR